VARFIHGVILGQIRHSCFCATIAAIPHNIMNE
jgi:hypothetical protein